MTPLRVFLLSSGALAMNVGLWFGAATRENWLLIPLFAGFAVFAVGYYLPPKKRTR